MSAKIEFELFRCTRLPARLTKEWRDRDSVFIYFSIWMSMVSSILTKYIHLYVHRLYFLFLPLFFSSLLKVYISILVFFLFSSFFLVFCSLLKSLFAFFPSSFSFYFELINKVRAAIAWILNNKDERNWSTAMSGWECASDIHSCIQVRTKKNKWKGKKWTTNVNNK